MANHFRILANGKNDRILKEKLPRSVGAQYATGDKWKNSFRKNEEMKPKWKQSPVVDVTSDESKVQCYKQQYILPKDSFSFLKTF